MALTLLEAAKLAPTVQEQTIIEEYAATSDILRVIPWENINGNAKSYNREDTLPGIGFRGVNEEYERSVGVINPQTEALKIAGGDLDVDRFLVDTQGSQVRSIHEMMKLKALSLAWTRNFVKGDSRVNPRCFDGLQVRLTGSQVLGNAPAGGPLSLAKLDELIDLVDEPTHLIVAKSVRRKLTALIRAGIGGSVEVTLDEFGRQAISYAGLPILIADYDNNSDQILGFTESSPDGSNINCTSIYCVSFGPTKVTGIQGKIGSKYGIDVRDLGELESKPVFRTRVDWYNAIAVYHGRGAARLAGITDQPAVA